MTGGNIHYEMSEETRAINCGGIGAIPTMVNKIGLRKEIDSPIHLLKRHLPITKATMLSSSCVEQLAG